MAHVVLAPLLMREQPKHARRLQVAHQQVTCLSYEVVVLAPLLMQEQPKHARRPQVAHQQVVCCSCAPVQVSLAGTGAVMFSSWTSS